MNMLITRNAHTPRQPARTERLYLDEMVNGWWTGVERTCPHGHGRLFLDPPRGDVGGRVYCLICAWEHRAAVLDTRRTSAPPVSDWSHIEHRACRGCGHREAINRGRPPEHWRHDLCSGCWAAKGAGR